jgi:hypothetical protein
VHDPDVPLGHVREDSDQSDALRRRDRALQVHAPLVERRIEKLRRAMPGATLRKIVKRLNGELRAATIGSGAGVGAVGRDSRGRHGGCAVAQRRRGCRVHECDRARRSVGLPCPRRSGPGPRPKTGSRRCGDDGPGRNEVSAEGCGAHWSTLGEPPRAVLSQRIITSADHAFGKVPDSWA